jgi:rhodanese-related sulfurtransferase
VAEQYREKGYMNVRALAGGIDAWRARGYPMKPME